jgi:DNA mismatch repair ATPase MutS
MFTTLEKELGDDFFADVDNHLLELRFRYGVVVSAKLGPGNKGASYVLRKPNQSTRNWFKRIFGDGIPAYTYYLAPRDEAGAQALGNLRDIGIRLVADATSQSTDHILSFFQMLRAELAFYIGCLNLHENLAEKSEPIAFPVPVALRDRAFSCRGLYDVCLSLTLGRKIVGNDIDADGAKLIVITGANQGGKSTFLRSVGLAQLMMQCGMFVAADTLRANVCDGLFTHYKREEDASMSSGKFDEELRRMSGIVEQLTPNSVMLFNESFASTNEREGSEIARQIVLALMEDGLKMFFVTHMYELAHGFYARGGDIAFLRAEREEGGERTFHLVNGAPLETSYGEDLYDAIFVPTGKLGASQATQLAAN